MKVSKILCVLCLLVTYVSSYAATPNVTISVDATAAPRKFFHATLKIPATPSDLTLYYPKWIPGEHAPDGPVVDLAGLVFKANGQTLKWRRDTLDGFTIHVEVPQGVSEVQADLDFLSPATFEGGFSAGSSATAKLAIISWNQVLLYPKGYKSDDINYTASLKIPEGWKFGTPLPMSETAALTVELRRGRVVGLDDRGFFEVVGRQVGQVTPDRRQRVTLPPVMEVLAGHARCCVVAGREPHLRLRAGVVEQAQRDALGDARGDREVRARDAE